MEFKLELDPSQDGGNQVLFEEQKSPIDDKSPELEILSKSRWKIGILKTPERAYIRQLDEELTEESQVQLRVSIQERRSNSKYVYAIYAEIKELTIFEQASENSDWEGHREINYDI
ncbi:hypothetical protein LIER_26047 [Lithospermum erythrorhizon]|uniref:Uncharacterized protein n=1 Tax=Lithospermum erythrorhizon TaxID=34254 RepID=A0AAV3RA73_LITER